MCSGAMVQRYAARDVLSWPVAAAARHAGSRVVALQRAVRPVAVARRSAGPHAGSLLGVVAREPHGTPVRQGAPWPEVPLGGPSRQVVLLGGLLAQPRPLGGLGLGRKNRCSPRSRTHQEKTRQREQGAEA